VKIRFPAALPHIFVGLKIAITFAVIGAVIGEFVGSEDGLPDPGVKLAIPHAIGVRGVGVIDRYEHRALLRYRVHRADCRAVGAEELIIPGVAMEDRNECCLA